MVATFHNFRSWFAPHKSVRETEPQATKKIGWQEQTEDVSSEFTTTCS